MSKSIRQSIAMLSVVAGCCSAIASIEAEPEKIRELAKAAYAATDQIILDWPVDNDNQVKARDWVDRVVRNEWFPEVVGDSSTYDAAMLASMVEKVHADLRTRVHDRVKLALLDQIQPTLRELHDHADPDGEKWEVYDNAFAIMDKLYSLIGWRWE